MQKKFPGTRLPTGWVTAFDRRAASGTPLISSPAPGFLLQLIVRQREDPGGRRKTAASTAVKPLLRVLGRVFGRRLRAGWFAAVRVELGLGAT